MSPGIGGRSGQASHPFGIGADPPTVSVIIPVRNEAASLAETLTAIGRGDYPGELEILVIDGGSTDPSRAIVESAGRQDARIRLLGNAAGATPAGLNVGLRAAKGEIIVRMDGHTQPAPDYVRRCVESLKRTGAWCVGGRMVGRGQTDLGRAVAFLTSLPVGAGDARFRGGTIAQGGEAVDTVYLGAWPCWVFERVGVFDEALARNQDYELAYRIRSAGGMVWLDPSIRSETATRGTLPELARQYFGYGQGRAATIVRHPASLRWRQMVPMIFVAALVGLFAVGIRVGIIRITAGSRATGLTEAWWPYILVLASILAISYAVVLLVGTVQVAQHDGWRAARWVPLALATMHVTWGLGAWSGLFAELSMRMRSEAS